MSEPLRIAFTDFWHGHGEAEVRERNPLYRMLSRHFDLRLSRDPEFVVYSCFGRRFLKYSCTRVFYTGENVRPNFAECDFAFSFDYPVTDLNYRLPLYRFYDHFDKCLPRPAPALDWSDKKFCNFVYSNARARPRIDFFHRLNRYRPVDSGGRLMNNVGGPVTDKLAFQSGYRFSIAFENSCHPGYTTEKVLDALIAGTVPIYWGNPLVARDFNPDCLINCHDFDGFDAVVEHVARVDRDPELYRRYVTAPVFPGDELPGFLREERIIQRFARIFRGTRESRVARPLDPLRYWLGPESVLRGTRRLWRQWRR